MQEDRQMPEQRTNPSNVNISISERPDISDGLFKWLWFHLKEDWPVLKKAPLGAACLVMLGILAGGGVIWFGVLVHKGAVIAGKTGIIELRDEKIRRLEVDLFDATNKVDLKSLPAWTDKTGIRRPITSDEDLKQDRIIGKTVFVSYIPPQKTRLPGIGPAVYEVRNKTFQECDLVGPAIVSIGGKSVVEYCSLEGPTGGKIESHLVLMQDKVLFGAIRFTDCGFLRCRFVDIGMAGDQVDLDHMKQAFNRP
jgi:hypothetical protein